MSIRFEDFLESVPSLKELIVSHRQDIQRYHCSFCGNYGQMWSYNLLGAAARWDRVEACKLLVEANLWFSSYGALQIAAMYDSVNCIRYFLANGTKIKNTNNDMDLAPLQLAINCKNARSIKLLMEAGSNLAGTCLNLRNVDDWIKEFQRSLSARQLGQRATKRALQHAKIHKDMIPLIVQWIAQSDPEAWNNETAKKLCLDN